MEDGIERAKWQKMRPVEGREPTLTSRLEKERMQRTGGSEANAKSMTQRAVDFPTGLHPSRFALSVREKRIERDFGALKCHRHAVAGERRNHRAGIADRNSAGSCRMAIKRQRGDRTKRRLIDVGASEPVGERFEVGRAQVVQKNFVRQHLIITAKNPARRSRGERGFGSIGRASLDRTPPEKPADVHRAVFDAGKAGVGLIAQMKLELPFEDEIANVKFQSDPRRFSATATVRKNPAGFVRPTHEPRLRAQLPASGDKGIGEPSIEGVTADSERGRR